METLYESKVSIPIGIVKIHADLALPLEAHSVILFSHGSGSSRFSPRNRMVAAHLQRHGFGTLLIDLLTPAEDEYYAKRFDISLLTKRLIEATEWLLSQKQTNRLNIGYFGASTGAASALMAAAHLPYIGAVVSRGGRPDLAAEALGRVKAPTLLIVGGRDTEVLALNRSALAQLNCTKNLEIVPGATHLFEEPGTLEQVADLATSWFSNYLAGNTVAS